MIKTDPEKRSIGIYFIDGVAHVRVWAPTAENMHVVIDEKQYELQKEKYGYWNTTLADLREGQLYKFLIDHQKALPDPASLAQPNGVHEHSAIVDLDQFRWTSIEWLAPPQEEWVIYELHAGCFSAKGNFEEIAERLDHLVELGINAIEIMPVAQFPGDRNWGYDGVYPFAVQHAYGGAHALQKLVDDCHNKGIAVILDVVYNHLGPEGNYLGAYGPYFTEKYKTPWGGAINFDDAYCHGVRHYFIENVMMWFRDFRIDGLRLDAVHAIKDFSPQHILEEISSQVEALQKITGRKHYLIAEVDLNDTRFIRQKDKGGYGMHAQWVDEFHHALRVTAGGERSGYYEDFSGIRDLAKAYTDAYVYDGQFSEHRNKFFGSKAGKHGGEQFIVFSQNHDQVGNRMQGERSSVLFSFEMQKLLAGAVMISPYLPMLFMGEEYGETNPFLYFVSHTDPDLAAAVRKGRKDEFAAFHSVGEAPDPMDLSTFSNSKLQWHLLNEDKHQALFRFYKELITIRKKFPALKNLLRRQLHVEYNKERNTLLVHRWQEEEHIICLMNFSKRRQYIMPPSYAQQWYRILDSAHPFWHGPIASPSIVSAAQPGTPTIEMQPESILVYCNHNKNS